MSRKTKAVLTVTLAVLAFAPAAMAQREEVRFSVPFDFAIGDRVLPAGSYAISRTSLLDPTVLSIGNEEPGRSSAYVTGAALDSRQIGAKVAFREYNGRYFLGEMWSAAGHRTLPITRTERALERTTAQTVVSTAGQ